MLIEWLCCLNKGVSAMKIKQSRPVAVLAAVLALEFIRITK